MRYALGVDGGNSKTHALVVDESGQSLGFGHSGGGNHQTRGFKAARREIERATGTAIRKASLSKQPLDMGCFCLAGADLPEDYAMLQEAMEDLGLTKTTLIKNDTIAALRAGLTRSCGVVIICGSGFNAAGRAPDGREIVLPGLGPESGDWGGGGMLSQEMIRMVMRAWDGRGKPTLLTQFVLQALQAPSEEVLLSRLYHEEIRRSRLLELVPLLFEAAEAGDEVARELVIQMGSEVGITALAIIRRLGLELEDVEVILGGSVFKGKGSLLLDTINRVVHARAPRARVIKPRFEPVVGAALLALEAMGVNADEQLYKILASTLPERLVITSTGLAPLPGDPNYRMENRA